MEHLKAKIIIGTVITSIVMMVLGAVAFIIGWFFRLYETGQIIGSIGALSFFIGIIVFALTNQSMYNTEVMYYSYCLEEEKRKNAHIV